MLKILGRVSSINVRKVLWACEELNIPYEHETWGDDVHSLKDPQFTSLNPNALIPVIQHDDFVLWESNSIIRYLANAFDGAWLYPSSPRERARIDQWIDWSATELNGAWRYAYMALMKHSSAHQDPQQIAHSRQTWIEMMQVLEQQLAAMDGFVTGDAFTLADIPVGLSVNRFYETPLEHPDLPAVRAYYARLTHRPGYAKWGRNGTP